MGKYLLWIIIGTAFLSACSQQRQEPADIISQEESLQAKNLLQGIWIDSETEEVTFRAKGDTIYYPDSVSQPAYFKIVNDTLILGSNHYAIIKQASHLFWFRNQMGDIVKMNKSDEPNDVLNFVHTHPQILTSLEEVQKTDSVVLYNGERYHWYIAINPTKYSVNVSSYNEDGVEVNNAYYDNIIHISVFNGSKRIYSNDFKKQMYLKQVPENFLAQSILGNMQFDCIDENGFHFNATLCIPDGAACYMVSTDIDFNGQLSLKLIEY